MPARSVNAADRGNSIILALQQIAAREGRTPVVSDYRRYRESNDGLPGPTAVYRHFGSWGEAVAAAGVDAIDVIEPTVEDKQQELATTLWRVAFTLGRPDLTVAMYDRYRADVEPELPSSARLRKELGSWPDALAAAGLGVFEHEATPAADAPPQRHPLAEALLAMRSVSRSALISPAYYDRVRESMPMTERFQTPRAYEIVECFGSWEHALAAAGNPGFGYLAADGSITLGNAYILARRCERILGTSLDQAGYDIVLKGQVATGRDVSHLPRWDTLRDLVGIGY